MINQIDVYVLYGYGAYNDNEVNDNNVHGVNVIEADGDSALWSGYNDGSSTDLFYCTNNTSFTPNSNPYTYYRNYLGGLSHTSVPSSVSITDISAPGNTMTFNYSY